MPVARLTIRPTPGNRLHNLWNNNGTWWVHYTLTWDGRKRRIRRSLGTKDDAEAIRLRDDLFATVEGEGEFVRDRQPPTCCTRETQVIPESWSSRKEQAL